VTAVLERPLLIYDGDCQFCNYSVDYARAATGPTIDYKPYQEVGRNFPAISEEDFQAAIYLVQPQDTVTHGAQAAFQTLALGGYTRLWDWCYCHLPLFALISEAAYRLVSRHRTACYRTSRVLFGPQLRPGVVHLTVWLFLRFLALIYLAAFASFTVQALGLIGEEGILSASRYFAAVDASYGLEKYWILPSLLWLDTSDAMIQGLGIAGCLFSLLLLINRWPRLCLPILYLLYLSILGGAQGFMSYQWDVLLLECGFLAIFLPGRERLFCWLYRWLLFRFMLQSGLVKLFSGDSAWLEFSALSFHFETQPLPTALAWYAHQWPGFILQLGVLFTLVVELLVPFMVLMPRRPRMLAATAIVVFQLVIIATGNYNFFNLLTLCLCILLLDDQFLTRILPPRLLQHISNPQPQRSPDYRSHRVRRVGPVLVGLIATVYLLQSLIILGYTGGRVSLSDTTRQFLALTAPLHMVNSLGPFAVMTRQRNEIVIEGSMDGREWLAYELPYKPGALDRAPVWATPHQPRLDWQLWFAALAPREQNPWLQGLMSGLLKGSVPVTGLFEYNPFAEQPPLYVRASLYRYRFSDSGTREQTGHWWTREYVGEFWPVSAWRLPVERESL
jgi:predicted DCC family thiol-disulfide oxidoreductase YuxK